MATPMKKQQVEMLEREGGEDMVFAWLAGGGTLTALAERMNMSRMILSQYCNRQCRKERYQKARQEGAAAFAEEGLSIVDKATPEDVQVAKLRADYRRFFAGKLDHDAWGEAKGNATVNVNLNNLHLDAVRQLSREEPKAPALEAGGGEDVEEADWLEAGDGGEDADWLDEGEGDWLE